MVKDRIITNENKIGSSEKHEGKSVDVLDLYTVTFRPLSSVFFFSRQNIPSGQLIKQLY